MTNTREEVADKFSAWYRDFEPKSSVSHRTNDYVRDMASAYSAGAASNSQYVPMLVEALKRVLNRAMVHDHEGYEEIAKQALNNLPEELRG